MTWRIFESAAAGYEGWYTTDSGRRADIAERGLLLYLLEAFPDAHRALEIGCGSGHFTGFLERNGLSAIGLDRAPAMLAQAAAQFPSLPLVLGDADHLPFRDASVDLALFITTLEFLRDPLAALREAIRVARQGVIAIALNRHSMGGFSRRWGPQSRGALLRHARDFSLNELRRDLTNAAGNRAIGMLTASTLFPGASPQRISRIALGDVIGAAVRLKNDAGSPG